VNQSPKQKPGFSLTRLFINRPTLVFVIISIMMFGGIMSTITIVKELYPDVSQPTVTVSVQYNGASVTEMRDEIVLPIEENLAGTQDLQTINTVVQQGSASISAVFDIKSDTATDLALTNKAVQAAEKYLPTNITPPTVNLYDPTESTVVTLALYSQKLPLSELAEYAQYVIAPALEQVPGISFANVGGLVTPAFEVQVDPAKLAANNLTLDDVINTISNDNERVPGGFAYEPNRQTTIDVRGDVTTLDQVRNLPIIVSGSTSQTNALPGQVNDIDGGVSSLPGQVDPWTASNSVVRVGDVATVTSGFEPRLQVAHISGKPGLFLQIQKTAQASEVDSSNAVIAALPKVERQFPEIKFRVINVQSKFTEQQIEIVVRTLCEAILLTGLAMVFFLRSWRSAIVVCVSIPTSLAIAITAMKLFGLTLDTDSLLGMSLVIGILVDDSTVVLENIERHFTELKQKPEDAAVSGREEIGAAAVVITLVDVVVFFPIAFIQGQVGRQLSEFAIVVVISTLTSLFVSFTITPTLAGLWALKSHWKPWKPIDWFGERFDALRSWYTQRALPWALQHGKLVAIFCMSTFVLAISLVPLGIVGEEFIPATDRGEIYIQVAYPIGTPLTTVEQGIFAYEKKILSYPDIFANTAVAGAYAASFGGFVAQQNVGQVHVWLKDGRKHPTSYWVTEFEKLAHAPGLFPRDVSVVVVPSTGTSGGNAQPVDFLVTDITGGDPTPYAQKVLDALKSVKGATSVNSSGTALTPEISVIFNREKAEALGVDVGQAAEAAGAAFGGNLATQFETQSGLEYVQVIYPPEDQTNLDMLRNVPIRSSNGSIVYLGDIATLESTPTPPLMTRTDRNTVIHVDSNVAPNSSLSNVENALMKKLPALHLPPNIVVRPAPLGQQDFMHQALVGMGTSMIISVILVYLLMVALYNDYLSPFIIIFSVPVAAIGAIGALVLTHRTLNLFSLIGTILLIGIATKNGILLVDYANTLRKRGKGKLEAIMESAHTRFRPIIMTSFSVVAGNLPLALALDPGSISRSSLGIVVIGGVVSSLVLTLLLIPNVYMWVSPSDERFRREEHMVGGGAPEPELAPAR
jgi:hydrophobic/amphiphilic exporter-1 (mainly G- bacteria), HAE1 family